MPSELLSMPLAMTGLRDSQTQINMALMLQASAWSAWAVLLVAGHDRNRVEGRNWLAAFFALKPLGITLVFTLAQATAIERGHIQNTLYLGFGALTSLVWHEFLIRRWPEASTPRVLRIVGAIGLLIWLGCVVWKGPELGWKLWPWTVVSPVVVGAWWLARREKVIAFAALGAALLIDFADPHTVTSWFTGFVQELSLTWAELEKLPPGSARSAPGNGLFVVPVAKVAVAWFYFVAAALWLGFLSWNFRLQNRTRFSAMPFIALGLTVVGFAIHGLSIAVAFRAMSRETFSRLGTLATVAPAEINLTSESAANWQALCEANSELGSVFRWTLDGTGQRVVLDPIAGIGRELSLLPLERAAVERGEPYGMGPFMAATGPSFYSAVRMRPDPSGMIGWLAVVGPLERFYVYKRPSALLSGVMMFLFGGIGVAMLGFMLHRDRGMRQSLARERAESAVQLKTMFLAKVSHELRTPLQGILGYGELLQRDMTDKTQLSRLNGLRKNGELMVRLVNDLLDLSALESGAFRLVERPTALREVVAQTVESLAPRAHAKGLKLHCTLDQNFPPWVIADAGRIRQITLNLVGNAIKFTAAGEVSVELHGRCSEDRCAVELVVTDTGPGIAAADQLRLFQMFSRLDLTSEHEGSGLGLALVAALCRRGGGDITVESDGHSGSCFRAQIDVRIGGAPESIANPPFPGLAGLRVLIVDDNALVRELFITWLSDLGAHCEVACDGEQALASATRGNFDAAILDLALPLMDGITVARRWREQGCTWQLVGVSAHAGEAERTCALAAGMDAFLVKPVEFSELARALSRTASAPATAAPENGLRSRLENLFRGEVGAQFEEVRDALACADWEKLRKRAHYLANSAGVVGDPLLYAACGAMEDAAAEKNLAAAEIAWIECSRCLAPWQSQVPPQLTSRDPLQPAAKS